MTARIPERAKPAARVRGPLRSAAGLLLWCGTALALVTCDTGGAGSVGANVVFPDPNTAALAEEAAAGDSARVRELVRAGADPNARGDKGTNLLQWALVNRSTVGQAADDQVPMLEASAKGLLLALRGSSLEVSKALAAKAIARLP